MAQQTWNPPGPPQSNTNNSNDFPPPPPPPPGPPPPDNHHANTNNLRINAQQNSNHSQQISQELSDKNARYLAKIRHKKANSFNPSNTNTASLLTPSTDTEPKRISLFSTGFLDNAKVSVPKPPPMPDSNNSPKKSSKFVELPPTGLTEKELFQKYRIESNAKIGAGAFARIKVVKDANNTKFALKMVKKKGRTRSDIEAFKKEILYLSMLTNHPNIIKMYDFCDSPQGLYMVLEFCNGGDVMEKMSLVHVFNENDCKHLVKQLIAGICYFHQYNIVHRDLKLDNLMFNNGILKIIDFGLAGDCTDKPLNTPCGTIHFTAPEVLQSYDYTTAADMWSLGVIIFLLICGFPPFFDNQGNEQKLFQIIKKGKFSFPKLYFDDKHPSLKELISDLIKKRPIERLTCEEVRKCEWLTGIKQPKKKIHNFINPFLENNENQNKKTSANAVNNPFLNNNSNQNEQKQQKWVPPYMRQQQQQKQQRMQYQQQNGSNMPGPPPQKQRSNGFGQYQQKRANVPGPPPPGTSQSVPGPPKIVMDL